MNSLKLVMPSWSTRYVHRLQRLVVDAADDLVEAVVDGAVAVGLARARRPAPSCTSLAGALHGEVDDRGRAAPGRGARCRSRTCPTRTVPPNGSSMWVCTSMPPGMTYLPVASITRSAATPTPATCPGAQSGGDASRRRSARPAAIAPVGLTTVPSVMRVVIAAPSARSGRRRRRVGGRGRTPSGCGPRSSRSRSRSRTISSACGRRRRRRRTCPPGRRSRSCRRSRCRRAARCRPG